MYEECGSNRCVQSANRSLLAAAWRRRSITRGTMRGEAMSLFDSAIVPAPSSDHSAKPAADAAIGGEVEVREDPDRLQARAASDSKNVWFAGSRFG